MINFKCDPLLRVEIDHLNCLQHSAFLVNHLIGFGNLRGLVCVIFDT